MKITVTGCENCPFRFDHTNSEDGSILYSDCILDHSDKEIKINYLETYPEWCKLKETSVVVELQTN